MNRFVYFAGEGGAESKETTPPPQLDTGKEGEVKAPSEAGQEGKGRAAKMVGAGMEQPEELADVSPDQALQFCMQVDNYLIQSVDRNAYAGKEEKLEAQLIESCGKVDFLKPGVDKYVAAYKAPDKPNVPTPNVLVEYVANALYKQVKSKFTDANGSTYENRGQDLTDYIYGPSSDEGQKATAKKAKDWFSTAKTAIQKGRAA